MTDNHVSIIDYGVGNINSVVNMFSRAGARVQIVRTALEVKAAERLVLPGVGAFDTCRQALNSIDGLEMAIHEAALRGTPLLGICVGMQLLATSSEEGCLSGLNLVPGYVRKFKLDDLNSMSSLRIPHMGWCSVSTKNTATLFAGELKSLNRFYFVHSYYFDCINEDDSVGKSNHGIQFTSAVERNNIFGVQFHPEKSHRYGLALFKNFLKT